MTTGPTAKHQQEARELVRDWLTTEGVALTGMLGEALRPKIIKFKESLERRIAAALSSRDREIRAVLEGLRTGECWCPDGQLMNHSPACLATRVLWNKVQG